MGGWPDHPVSCPECGGEGFVGAALPAPVAPELVGLPQTSRCRCDVCHGLGKIERREADHYHTQNADRETQP